MSMACEAREICGRVCGETPCALAAAWMRRVMQTRRTRAELGALDDGALKDIGLARCEIDYVAAENYR
jgi:uncharacterized protein YjiS (DUF1127 family)